MNAVSPHCMCMNRYRDDIIKSATERRQRQRVDHSRNESEYQCLLVILSGFHTITYSPTTASLPNATWNGKSTTFPSSHSFPPPLPPIFHSLALTDIHPFHFPVAKQTSQIQSGGPGGPWRLSTSSLIFCSLKLHPVASKDGFCEQPKCHN